MRVNSRSEVMQPLTIRIRLELWLLQISHMSNRDMAIKNHLPNCALLKVVVEIVKRGVLIPPFLHQKWSKRIMNSEEHNTRTRIIGIRKIAEELVHLTKNTT